jgi:hypothetical protein
MQRVTELEAVFDRVWTRVEGGAREPGHPFRTPTIATASADGPAARTVVLRDADRETRRLAFHTDRQSEKVRALREMPRVAWHWWDPSAREQVRLRGTATVHADDAVADAMWDDQSPASLAVHVREVPSGTPLDAPRDALGKAVRSDPITRDDVAPGREHFAVVRTVVDSADWLHLHPDGHYRARFRCPPEEAVEGTWVAP